MKSIKELRENIQITQEELAHKAGVSCSIISGLETGELAHTTLKTLARIAVALETTIDEMCGFNNLVEEGVYND